MAPVTTRQRYLEAVVELMIVEGRVDQTLDALAAAAGTSDRMLVYYFETRDALVAEAVRLLRERRRQLANTVMTRISLAPTAIEGIRDGLLWLTEPEQIAVTRLLRTTTARALRGEELFEEFVDLTIGDWIEEATLTGRRLGADAETAPVFATLLVALGDALAVDRYATTDLDRIEASIMSAASLLAGLVGAPTTYPEPEPESEPDSADGADGAEGADAGEPAPARAAPHDTVDR
jgi:AcrR family transcriptional regulator